MTGSANNSRGLRYFPVLWRFPLLLLHALIGLPLAMLSLTPPWRSIKAGESSLDERMIRWWSHTLCRIFGVRVRWEPQLPPPPLLIVANHSSWLDIVVLQSLRHLHLVAKAEIASWPLIGWVGKRTGAIFHARGSSTSLSDASDAVIRVLKTGVYAGIFPEGGVNDGITIRRFHARMFRAAIETGCAVQPVCIRYIRNGAINVEVSYRDKESTGHNMLRLLLAPAGEAEVIVLPAFLPAGQNRRELAERAHAMVTEAYGSSCD